MSRSNFVHITILVFAQSRQTLHELVSLNFVVSKFKAIQKFSSKMLTKSSMITFRKWQKKLSKSSSNQVKEAMIFLNDKSKSKNRL